MVDQLRYQSKIIVGATRFIEGNLKILGRATNSKLRWISDLTALGGKYGKKSWSRSYFMLLMQFQVLQIIIPRFIGEDFIIARHYENNGLFLVKGAYKLAVELQANHIDASMSNMLEICPRDK